MDTLRVRDYLCLSDRSSCWPSFACYTLPSVLAVRRGEHGDRVRGTRPSLLDASVLL